MPVKWSPELDQLLLVLILQTHNIQVNAQKLADNWPQDRAGEKPTPRAITERFVKIRKDSSVKFGISSAQGRTTFTNARSAASTPLKVNGTPKGTGTAVGNPKSNGKRRRKDTSDEGEDDVDDQQAIEKVAARAKLPRRSKNVVPKWNLYDGEDVNVKPEAIDGSFESRNVNASDGLSSAELEGNPFTPTRGLDHSFSSTYGLAEDDDNNGFVARLKASNGKGRARGRHSVATLDDEDGSEFEMV